MKFDANVPVVQLLAQKFLSANSGVIASGRYSQPTADNVLSTNSLGRAHLVEPTRPINREVRLGAQRVPDQARYESSDASGDQTGNDTDRQAFPTEAAEKKRNAKRAAKAAGIEWKTNPRKFTVEDHYDDCGGDTSAIEVDLSHFGSSLWPIETDSEDECTYVQAQCGLEQFALFGPNLTGIPMVSHNVDLFPNANSLFTYLSTLAPPTETINTSDLLELCSCSDNSGRISARVTHQNGRADTLADVQFAELETQHAIASYYRQSKPAMIVLSTSGTDGFFHKVAAAQVRDGRHFVAIIHGNVPLEWRNVSEQPEVMHAMSGQTTVFTTSDEVLNRIMYARSGDQSDKGQWTWTFAVAVIEGLEAHRYCYPSVGTGPGDESEAADAEDSEPWRKCDGCRGRKRATDPLHSRIPGECKYPLVEPVSWDCVGCAANRPRWHSSHSYKPEECKWAVAQTRSGTKRKGRHPRDGRKKASAEPTAGLPGSTPEGELGAGDEVSAENMSGLPDDAFAPTDTEGDAPEAASAEGARSSSSASAAPPSGRGPDRVPRTVRTWKDVGTGESPTNWSQYDIQRVMRSLGCTGEAGRRRLLRKLHLRWWHAAAAPMKRLLKHAGMPDEVLSLVDEIVDTCSVCRTWSKPLPASVASVSIPTAFNDQVETDLMLLQKDHYSSPHLSVRALALS